MPKVAVVRLGYNARALWFDPQMIELHAKDAVIVQTERGLEYGVVEDPAYEVSQDRIEDLNCELKPVVRVCTAQDESTVVYYAERAIEALPIFKDLVASHGLDMRPIAVEFLFDGDKAVFYYESEDRVDFRELVRALAAQFHCRIDMRQIGARDEARMVGGIGHCGQELCCKRLGGMFNPVSIRMAKDQDLSLNPQKISGACGRLMCCLRYEADTYKELKACCPKVNSMVDTPEGEAKVLSIDVLRETVTLHLDDKTINVPIARMTTEKGSTRPSKISAEVLADYIDPEEVHAYSGASLAHTNFTGTDKLADFRSQRSSDTEKPFDIQEGEQRHTSRRRRRRQRDVAVLDNKELISKTAYNEHEKRDVSHSMSSRDNAKESRRRRRRRRGDATQDVANEQVATHSVNGQHFVEREIKDTSVTRSLVSQHTTVSIDRPTQLKGQPRRAAPEHLRSRHKEESFKPQKQIHNQTATRPGQRSSSLAQLASESTQAALQTSLSHVYNGEGSQKQPKGQTQNDTSRMSSIKDNGAAVSKHVHARKSESISPHNDGLDKRGTSSYMRRRRRRKREDTNE